MPEFIDLGISRTPEATIEIKEEAPDKYYPCFYLTSEEPVDLGDAGTAIIRYKLIERAEKTRDGKDEYRYELEVHGISPVSSEEVDDEIEEEVPVKKKKRGLTQNFGDILDKVTEKRSRDEEY